MMLVFDKPHMRMSGIIHARKTNSSANGPYSSIKGQAFVHNGIQMKKKNCRPITKTYHNIIPNSMNLRIAQLKTQKKRIPLL